MKYTTAFTTLALLTVCLHADDAPAPEETKPTSSPHRLSFGPDAFYMDAEVNADATVRKKTDRTCVVPKMKMKLDGEYTTFGLGYDYLESNAVYAGADVSYGIGTSNTSRSVKSIPIPAPKKDAEVDAKPSEKTDQKNDKPVLAAENNQEHQVQPNVSLNENGTEELSGISNADILNNSALKSIGDKKSIKLYKNDSKHHAKNSHNFFHAEGRLGYSFGAAKDLIVSPYMGIGTYYWNLRGNDCVSLTKEWIYGAVGVKSLYSFNSIFDMGLNLKGMRALHTYWHCSVAKDSKNRQNSWGYEVSAPMDFHFGPEEVWSITLDPYFTKLDAKTDMNIFGARLMLGCRF